MHDTFGGPVFGERVAGVAYRVRPSAYVVLRDASGRVAVVRTPRGGFLPGGGLDPDETPDDCVRREAQEETGLVLGPLVPLGTATELIRAVDEDAWFEKRCTFYTSVITGQGAPTEPDHALVWLTDDDACALLGHASHRWALAR